MSFAASLSAQLAPEQGSGEMVLRAYANLVQIPVLVLRSDHSTMPPLDVARFRISLDAGPPFAPRHVRRQGEDPMRVALVMDESTLSADEIAQLPTAASVLHAPLIQAGDRLSMSASVGCTIAGTSVINTVTAENLQRLSTALIETAKTKNEESGSAGKVCKPGARLWDSVAFAMQKLKGDPGRRVIIAITNGEDKASKWKPAQLRELAIHTGVTLFAIRPSTLDGNKLDVDQSLLHRGIYGLDHDPLTEIAELSGGMVLEGTGKPIAKDLQRVVAMVRDRYIIDFVRPSYFKGGLHGIEVSIGDRAAFIRTGGNSVPLPDAKELADPNRVPNDPSLEPVAGKRGVPKP